MDFTLIQFLQAERARLIRFEQMWRDGQAQHGLKIFPEVQTPEDWAEQYKDSAA